MENGQPKEYTVLYEEIKDGEQLGQGQFGTVHKTHHSPSGLTFAVKKISDKCMDSSSNERNTENMDLAVLLKLGEGCPYLIKFYGAIHAEVSFLCFGARFFYQLLFKKIMPKKALDKLENYFLLKIFI